MDISWDKNSAIHAHIVFRKAERIISANINKAIKKSGLTVSQFGILDVLYTKGEMKICELLNRVIATSGNMTVILKNMENSNLIYRQKDKIDKRAFVVGITEKGKKLFEDILPEHRKELENIYSILTEEDKKTLINILKKFKNISTKSEEIKCKKKY